MMANRSALAAAVCGMRWRRRQVIKQGVRNVLDSPAQGAQRRGVQKLQVRVKQSVYIGGAAKVLAALARCRMDQDAVLEDAECEMQAPRGWVKRRAERRAPPWRRNAVQDAEADYGAAE